MAFFFFADHCTPLSQLPGSRGALFKYVDLPERPRRRLAVCVPHRRTLSGIHSGTLK
jgi:hypothetical protein